MENETSTSELATSPSPFRGVQPGSASLISVFPISLEFNSRHTGMMTYTLPAAKKDKHIVVRMNPTRMYLPSKTGEKPYTITEKAVPAGHGYTELIASDTYVWMRSTMLETTELVRMPRSAEQVCQGLSEAWNAGRPTAREGGSRGIAPRDLTRPLAQQLKELRIGLTELARLMVMDADGYFQRREWKSILPIHREMAAWLGVVREWTQPIEEKVMKTCKACAHEILAQAIICEHCGTDVIKFAQENGESLDDDPIAKMVAARRVSAQAGGKGKSKEAAA